VLICSECGFENPEGHRFCGSCAAPLSPLEVREQRKTVTVVFCDLVGSTALGESQDPEAVRRLLARYYDRMREIVEAHGGTVAKFIGDAVLAVFGVPVAHEDDALRSLRAALEMREALPELGLQARLGVNTGEVMTSSDDALVTGDAVNVAARLEQAAGAGEIFVGAETVVLAGGAARVEELERFVLKGKADPVPVYRLLAVGEAQERPRGARFVGRGTELELLRQAWHRVVEAGGCELVTVVGEAGVGKSRLTAELIAGLDARVVGGRCLSYGDGVGYRPVVEVIRQLDARPEDESAASTLDTLLGESDAETTPEEIAWAFRKLLDQEAPLVAIFDDIQWGEEIFLDLVEQAGSLCKRPVLLLCLARPELVERRPGWPAVLRLQPLDREEVEQLLPGSVPAGLRERIARAAGGNPLFVTEMVAMATGASDEMIVPATLKALLAARLDQVEGAERGVLERGAIEGELFHRATVQALTGAQVSPQLASLVRHELIRPDSGLLPGEDAFRFCHLLMRDAAYDAMPKAIRAELHERFAGWLEHHGGDLVERDEIVGYHLERAFTYGSELGTNDATLGDRAAVHLATAAQRARDRGDRYAEAKLLERALAVGLGDPRARAGAQLKLGVALHDTGRPVESERVLTDVAAAAAALADRGLAAHAAFALAAGPRLHLGDRGVPVEELIDVFAQIGDDLWLSRALHLRATGLVRYGRFEEGQALLERALVHAEASGDREERRGVIRVFCTHLGVGPTPVGPATARVEEVLAAAAGDWVLEAQIKPTLAWLYAMAGRSEDALLLVRESIGALAELGSTTSWMVRSMAAGDALELAGDLAAAERERKDAFAYFQALRPDKVFGLAWHMGAYLGRVYCDEGRWDEAEEALAYGRDAVIPTMPMSQLRRLAVEARLAAHRGELEEAVALAERAVAESATKEWPNHQAEMWLALAEVQLAAGRRGETDAAVARALELYEQKGNVAEAARVRAGIEAR
jgi:class 3 adenylate cyclase/tetratricopeptide (TPR) repeat protein